MLLPNSDESEFSSSAIPSVFKRTNINSIKRPTKPRLSSNEIEPSTRVSPSKTTDNANGNKFHNCVFDATLKYKQETPKIKAIFEIFEPIAVSLGIEPLAFAIIGIIAIEAGLLTPPFGILVYTVKVAANDKKIKIGEIFTHSIPYWLIMLFAVFLLIQFPIIATYLPNLVFG